jgi:hypothetical protein
MDFLGLLPIWILVVLIAVIGGASWWEIHVATAIFTAATGGLELIRDGIGQLIAQLRTNAAPTKLLERMDALERAQLQGTQLAQDAVARATQLGARLAARKRWDADAEAEEEGIPLTPEQKMALLEQLGLATTDSNGQPSIARPGATSSGKSLARRAFEQRRRMGE